MGSRFFIWKIVIYLLSVCGAAHVKAAWSKEPSPEEDFQVLEFAAKLFLTCLATSAKKLLLSLPILSKLSFPGPGALQVLLPVQESGKPRCCCSSGEYNTWIQVWGGFRTVSPGHSLKHPPLNTAMNSPTDLMVKIILCISSFCFYVPLFT